ncbi:hypothetical protein BC829DRAFT_426275 [Chytridium lagenaria]|nr:hypothetical protein BC829DRAFT_426275 [Chytridium lagenaria]
MKEFGSKIEWVMDAIDNPHFIVVVYFLLNLSMTMYNKAIMKLIHFNYPWLLTAIHTFMSCIGSIINAKARKKAMTLSTVLMFLFSCLYTVNIAVSNVSLNMVVAAVSSGRSKHEPGGNVSYGDIVLWKKGNEPEHIPFINVIAGVALATLEIRILHPRSPHDPPRRPSLLPQRHLHKPVSLVGSLHFHPLDLLSRMSGAATLQCLLVSWWSGELKDVFTLYHPPSHVLTTQRAYWKSLFAALTAGLLLNGVLAFFLNFVSF